MTDPGPDASIRFALLTNGSGFSCAVLEQLERLAFVPSLIVLPEYPPAAADGEIFQVNSNRAFHSLASGIERAYAPREWQGRCAEHIRRSNIDFLLVACWPYLIDTELRDSPRLASLNLHPSRLPRYRGADPLQQQIAARDCRSGITLHLLDDRFDHGDIIAQHSFEVDATQLEAGYLETRCARAGVELFIDAARSGQGSWQPVRQRDQALETD